MDFGTGIILYHEIGLHGLLEEENETKNIHHFVVINKWNWNIKQTVMLQMKVDSVLAPKAYTPDYPIQPLQDPNMILNIYYGMNQWNIANSLHVKGCFGAINVWNEIEIEKFFGTNIIKIPFPYTVTHDSTALFLLLNIHFIT